MRLKVNIEESLSDRCLEDKEWKSYDTGDPKTVRKVYSRDSITGIAQFFAVKMSSGKDVPAIYLCLFEATKERYQEDGRILD